LRSRYVQVAYLVRYRHKMCVIDRRFLMFFIEGFAEHFKLPFDRVSKFRIDLYDAGLRSQDPGSGSDLPGLTWGLEAQLMQKSDSASAILRYLITWVDASTYSAIELRGRFKMMLQ
jgi:hypothetical protein